MNYLILLIVAIIVGGCGKNGEPLKKDESSEKKDGLDCSEHNHALQLLKEAGDKRIQQWEVIFSNKDDFKKLDESNQKKLLGCITGASNILDSKI